MMQKTTGRSMEEEDHACTSVLGYVYCTCAYLPSRIVQKSTDNLHHSAVQSDTCNYRLHHVDGVKNRRNTDCPTCYSISALAALISTKEVTIDQLSTTR